MAASAGVATKASASVQKGAAADLTPTATKANWAFVGWNTDKNANTGLSSLTVNGNTTLYAIFKAPLIPDPGFEAAIRDAIGKPTGELTKADLAQVEELYLYGGWGGPEYNVRSLEGIKNCTSLKWLVVYGDLITDTADFSGMTSLQMLGIFFGQVTRLNVSGCTALTQLDCLGSTTEAITMNNHPALEYFDCSENNITSLNLSGCPQLVQLTCDQNDIHSLDLSGCPKLGSLTCSYNNLSSLNLGGCTKLYRLQCFANNLTSLDIRDCASTLHDYWFYYNCFPSRAAILGYDKIADRNFDPQKAS